MATEHTAQNVLGASWLSAHPALLPRGLRPNSTCIARTSLFPSLIYILCFSICTHANVTIRTRQVHTPKRTQKMGPGQKMRSYFPITLPTREENTDNEIQKIEPGPRKYNPDIQITATRKKTWTPEMQTRIFRVPPNAGRG